MSRLSNAELEVWINEIIETAEKGQPNEDATVELKRQFPTPPEGKTDPTEIRKYLKEKHLDDAEQLAALANAARGENVLWVVGVKDKKGVVGESTEKINKEPNEWWQQVEPHFEEVAPRVLAHKVLRNKGRAKGTVVAFLFSTDEAPYIVKPNPENKGARKWVPWRHLTTKREATRNELFQMLLPTIKAPKIEVRHGSFIGSANAEFIVFKVAIDLYLIPATQSEVVTIPLHKIKGILVLSEGDYRIESELPVRIEALEITEQIIRLNEKISTTHRQSTYVGQELIFCDTPKPVRLQQTFCIQEVPIEWSPAFIDVSYKDIQATYELEMALDQLDHTIKRSIPLKPR